MSTDTLHHPPKPASVGLGPDNQRPDAGPDRTVTDDRAYVRDDRYEAAPEGAAATGAGVTDLIKSLRDESLHLLRQEVNLAKTEMQEKASYFANQSGKLATGGAVLALGGLLLLWSLGYLASWVYEAIFPITTELALFLGFLTVGLITALIGYSLFKKAKRNIKSEPVTPERTLQSLKEDKQWLSNKSTEVAHEATRTVKGPSAS